MRAGSSGHDSSGVGVCFSRSLLDRTARLQTLDRGAPVSLYTVSRELGHGSEEMVRRVHAHLGSVRHRSEVVEYRLEQHVEALKDRLGALGFVTRNVTRDAPVEESETPATWICKRGRNFRSGPGATRTRDLLLRRRTKLARAGEGHCWRVSGIDSALVCSSPHHPSPVPLALAWH
jgi:hypothetical protein